MAGFLALPLFANAQPITGPYVSLGGGLSIAPNTSKIFGYAPGINGGDIGPAGYPVEKDDGYVVSGAGGYGFGNGLRLELEAAYRSNPLTHLITPYGAFNYQGNEQNTSLIASILYDFELGLPVYPYLGAGIGAIFDTESKVTITKSDLFGINFYEVNDGTAVATPAFQITGGVAYPISAVPGLSLTLDYKFLTEAQHRSFNRTVTNTFAATGAAANQGSGYATFSNESLHAIMFGVRYAFGAPAPRPPAAPVPAAVPPSPVSRSYLVFFDWDKAVLTDRAKQIVAEAAAASTKVQVTRIEVNGYTDTSGTPTYNQGLSVARAKAVMAELLKDGVPASAMVVMGYGETHLLVPTGNGVREPQNRRVEIIIK
jgi:outer membrane protein OmpA-like peptidoglycan-associated protein